jgi:hypothetical protein
MTSANPALRSPLRPATTAGWEGFHPREHFVQFYEADSVLVDAVSGYAMKAMAEGSAAIIVATRAHRDAIEERWAADGFDVEAAREQERYVPLDAQETLDRFLVDGWPQQKLFAEAIEPVIVRAASRYAKVVAFGEMVALLWKSEQYGAAIHL